MAEDKEFTAVTPYACGWTMVSCCDALNSAEDPVAQRAVNTAAEILYALSGRQFGLCELTVRPCRVECYAAIGQVGPRWTPALVGGEWINVSCGACRNVCSCSRVCEVSLPGPIDSVSEVLLDGVALDEDQYRVDNRRTLVRLTEGECWPICQDMGKASTETGTWEVTYKRGKPLPSAGKDALSTFACEIVKACTNDTSCALPKRLTSITRQGVSMAILDPMPFIEKNKTGLYLVDAWLQAVNPMGRPRAAAILSPDMPQTRRTTWPM